MSKIKSTERFSDTHTQEGATSQKAQHPTETEQTSTTASPQKVAQFKQASFAKPGVSTRTGDQGLAKLMGQTSIPSVQPSPSAPSLSPFSVWGQQTVHSLQQKSQHSSTHKQSTQTHLSSSPVFTTMESLSRSTMSPSIQANARGFVKGTVGADGNTVQAKAADVLAEVKKTVQWEPSSRYPVGFPNAAAMSEEDIGAIGHGLLLRQPTAIIVHPKGGGDPITLDPLEIQSLYLQLNGFNAYGDSVQQLLSQGRNPQGAWDSSVGNYSLKDLDKWQGHYRENALARLDELGLTEEQFYALVNDAQVVRDNLSLDGLAPYEFAKVEFHDYDLDKVSSKKTGITGDTQVSMKQYNVSLHEIGELMDEPGKAHFQHQLEATANYLKTHKGITDLDISALGDKFNQMWLDTLTEAVENNKPPELATYAKLMQLKAAYESGELPYEYEELLDVEELDAKLAIYTDPTTPQGKVVTEQFQQVQEAARAELYGEIKDKVEAHKDYLKSDAFQERLALLPEPSQRALVTQIELAKLAALDPQAAQEVSSYLMAQEIINDPVKGLQGLTDEERVAALEEALGQLAATEGIELDDATLREYAQQFSIFFNEVPPGTSPADLLSYANKAAGVGGSLEKLAGTPIFSALTKKGMNALACATLVVGLYKHGFKAETPMDVWKSITSTTKLAGKLATTLGNIQALGEAGKSLGKIGEILGPIGDALTIPLDAYNLARDIKRGDAAGTAFKSIGLAAGFVSLTAGLLALGSTGVGAPVAAVAGLVAFSAWLGDSIFGENDQAADTLKQLGVYKND